MISSVFRPAAGAGNYSSPGNFDFVANSYIHVAYFYIPLRSGQPTRERGLAIHFDPLGPAQSIRTHIILYATGSRPRVASLAHERFVSPVTSMVTLNGETFRVRYHLDPEGQQLAPASGLAQTGNATEPAHLLDSARDCLAQGPVRFTLTPVPEPDQRELTRLDPILRVLPPLGTLELRRITDHRGPGLISGYFDLSASILSEGGLWAHTTTGIGLHRTERGTLSEQ